MLDNGFRLVFRDKQRKCWFSVRCAFDEDCGFIQRNRRLQSRFTLMGNRFVLDRSDLCRRLAGDGRADQRLGDKLWIILPVRKLAGESRLQRRKSRQLRQFGIRFGLWRGPGRPGNRRLCLLDRRRECLGSRNDGPESSGSSGSGKAASDATIGIAAAGTGSDREERSGCGGLTAEDAPFSLAVSSLKESADTARGRRPAAAVAFANDSARSDGAGLCKSLLHSAQIAVEAPKVA